MNDKTHFATIKRRMVGNRGSSDHKIGSKVRERERERERRGKEGKRKRERERS